MNCSAEISLSTSAPPEHLSVEHLILPPTLTEPDAVATFDANEEYQATIRLEAEISMLVTVNPTLKLYAYRKYPLPVACDRPPYQTGN